MLCEMTDLGRVLFEQDADTKDRSVLVHVLILLPALFSKRCDMDSII